MLPSVGHTGNPGTNILELEEGFLPHLSYLSHIRDACLYRILLLFKQKIPCPAKWIILDSQQGTENN